MTAAENKYSFRQTSQLSLQCGLIGSLRADIDLDGNGFLSDWTDWDKRLKTDEFKSEFDELVNTLRQDGKILHNRKVMANYCYSTPESKMPEKQEYYGVRIDTEKYTYLLRLAPNRGENNLYCFCYYRSYFDSHIKAAAKGIRFVDGNYNTLFILPDGGKLRICFLWGTTELRTCRFVDDYHMQINDNIYHIYEWYERMKLSGHTYEPAATTNK